MTTKHTQKGSREHERRIDAHLAGNARQVVQGQTPEIRPEVSITGEQLDNIVLHYFGREGDQLADGMTIGLVRILCRMAGERNRLREALQWIVTDAVFKAPEQYADPDVTCRWVQCAQAALSGAGK